MKCKDFMRRPVQTLPVGATVEIAAQRMKDSNIGLIPICGRTGTPLGVLTDRDIAVRVVAQGLAPSTPCERVMTTEIVWSDPDDELEFAARIMGRQRKSRILIMRDANLVGILSLADLAVAKLSIAALALHEVAAREILDPSGVVYPNRH